MKDLREESGAVFLMATFVGLLLVSMVLHVAGTGQAAVEQATMQDAADATALSAAASHARGLNIIALINMVMAAILAVLVALRLAEALATVLVVGVAAGCAIPYTAAAFCGFVEPANEVRSTLSDAADAYEDLAKETLEQLHDASAKVSDYMPYVSQAEALNISTQSPYSPPATGGVVWPFTEGLPTKDGSFEKLCHEAAKNVIAPVKTAFGPVGDIVDATLGEAIEGLAGAFTDYFCGDSDSGGSGSRQSPQRPNEVLRRDVAYPVGRDGLGSRRVCASQTARVDSLRGTCASFGSCIACAAMGCDDCFGKWSQAEYQRGLWTVVRDEWVEWTDEGRAHRLVLEPSPVSGVWQLVEEEGDPCRYGGVRDKAAYRNCHLYDTGQWTTGDGGYNAGPGPSRLPFDPVCTLETRRLLSLGERSAYAAPAGVSLERVTLKSYLVLSGCVTKEDITVEAQGEPVAGSDDERSSMAPRELDVERYEAESTMYSILLGRRTAMSRLREMDLFDHGSGSILGQRLSVAAAEYYSIDDYEQSMWHMRWLSRLVRFSIDGAMNGSDESTHQAKELLDSGLRSDLEGNLSGSIDDYMLH